MKGETYKGYILTDNDWSRVGRSYVFKTFKVFYANEKRNSRLLYERDFNDSFTGQFLKDGFETFGVAFIDGCNDTKRKPEGFKLYKKPISPVTNWFGTSVMCPDTIFIKEDKEMIMSLQGISTPYNEKYKTLFEERSVKYIKLKKGNTILYEDWTGNLPPKELVQTFLTM